MEVYLDLVVLLNFLVDLLLLLGTNRLAGFPLAVKRCAAAAALGGVYSGVCLLRGFHFLGSLLWRCVCLALMCAIAFGWNISSWKRSGVFILLSMALGGMALSVGRGDFWTLCVSAAGICLLCRLAFGQTVGGREFLPLTIVYGGKRVDLVALRDSGNTLRDPVTGERVFLIAAEAARQLTGLTEAQLRKPLETLTQRPLPGLRLIPYRSVGNSGGLLLGMRFHHIKLGEQVLSAVVGFAPEGLGRGEIYQALVAVE